MAITNDELKELFENFQWIDDIPEDQVKRDAIWGFFLANIGN